MKRLSLLLSGLVVAATLSGCCCHRGYNNCSPCAPPCSPCASPCSPCGVSYAQQVQPAYGPVSYDGGPVAVGNPGCSSCNNLSY